jgi:hypothetical protein
MAGITPKGLGTLDYLINISSTVQTAYALLKTDSDGSWAKSFYKKSVAADTDGDGKDEVVIAYFDTTKNALNLRVEKYASNAYNINNVQSYSDSTITTSNIDQYRCSIDAGDIDGDGRDEILVTYNNTLVIFDDANASYVKLLSQTYDTLKTGKAQYVRVKTGDFDADGKAEIVVTNGNNDDGVISEYYIYEDITASAPKLSLMSAAGSKGSISVSASIGTGTSKSTRAIEAANIAIGDFDGDKIPDVAFNGSKYSGDGIYLLILKTSIDDTNQLSFSFLSSANEDSEDGQEFVAMDAGDIDGDAKDEIAMWDEYFRLNENGQLIYVENLKSNSYCDCLKIANIDAIESTDNDATISEKRKKEIIQVANSRDDIFVSRYTSSGSLNTTAKSIDVDIQATQPTICFPSTQSGADVLQYTGHEVKFTEPRILAVLAAPPYYGSLGTSSNPDEIQPFLGNCATYFGKAKSTATTETQKAGFNVDFSVGYVAEAPVLGKSAGSSQIKFTVSNSFDYISTKSSEIEYSYGYQNSTTDNLVVFTCIPFDVYYYKVLNSSNAASIGTTMTINMPRQPINTSQSQTYYNANNGDYYDVDSSVMVHTIGKPKTYTSYVNMAALKTSCGSKGLFIPDSYAQTVGSGNAGTELSIESISTTENTFEYNLSVGVEVENVAGGFLVGGGFAMHYGYSYTSSVTKGTEVEGTVPNIADSFYSTANRYTWGLMAYPYTDSKSNQSFTVVTYWVK